MQKWINSIFWVMLAGWLLMLGCGSIVLHYKRPELVFLYYDLPLTLCLAICGYGLFVISRAVFKNQGEYLKISIEWLGVAVGIYAITFQFYTYGSWRTPLGYASLVSFVWLAYLHRRVSMKAQ